MKWPPPRHIKTRIRKHLKLVWGFARCAEFRLRPIGKRAEQKLARSWRGLAKFRILVRPDPGSVRNCNVKVLPMSLKAVLRQRIRAAPAAAAAGNA